MNAVRKLRAQTGATQVNLASAAQTSQPTIASYEAGDKSPTLETLERLARSQGLELTVSYVPPLTREDKRSLAYHRAIVEKIRLQPEESLARARANLKKMSKLHPHAKKLVDRWRDWLNLPLAELIHWCLDASFMARDMRQVTPFAGLLSQEERLVVLEKFRRELAK